MVNSAAGVHGSNESPSDQRGHVRTRGRRHQDMYSYIPHYMNITTTGAFSINTGTETFSFYKPNTYWRLRRFDDRPRQPPVRHRRRDLVVRLEYGVERPLDGPDLVQRRRDGTPARRLPARQGLRIPRIRRRSVQDITQFYMAPLRPGHVARVVEAHVELRHALGAVVPAEQPGPLRSTTSTSTG